MTETQLKVKVQKYLKSIGAIVMKISDRFSSGYPDLTIVYNKQTYFIELKTETGRVSAIQQYYIDTINKAGGLACVCRNLEQVKSFLATGKCS